MFHLPPHGGFLQFHVHHGDMDQNMKTVREAIEKASLKKGTVVVLPELWATDFAYSAMPGMAERTDEVLAFLAGLARKHSILIAGSLPERIGETEKPRYHNTLFLTGPDGLLGAYRKQQLFAPMGEDKLFSPGRNPAPISTPFGVIGGLVCFDLRFPDLAWSQAARGAFLIVVSAQWPRVRKDHWRTLLIARAIENQTFVIGCNRIGAANEIEFGGNSMIVAPNGAVLEEAGEGEAFHRARLDPALLDSVRSRFRTAGVTPPRFENREKIVSLERGRDLIDQYKSAGRRIVFTNGCFDILHAGHVTYLEKARHLGDCLVVGLNSDASVRAIKGPDRPVNDENARAMVLAALECVDHVILFDEETPLHLITSLMPHVLVKGSDWAVGNIVGAPEVLAAGGRVETIALHGNCSTTGIIEKIRKR